LVIYMNIFLQLEILVFPEIPTSCNRVAYPSFRGASHD
jgi:hypothetical protein